MLFKFWFHLLTNMTKAELALEPAIAALGKRYRSQHLFPGLKHVADFALLDEKIIIEVDGPSHQEPKQRRKDATHELALRRLGWRVVRCTNEDAISQPHLTVATLQEKLNHLPTLEDLQERLAQFGPPEPRKPPKKPRQKRGTAPKSAPSPAGPTDSTADRKPR